MLNIQVMIVQHLFFSQLLFEMRTMLYAIVKALHLYVLHRLQKRLKTAVLSFWEKTQFREILTVYRWIGFVKFGIVLVEMVENDFSFAVLDIKVMGVRVGFQWFSQKTQDNTS